MSLKILKYYLVNIVIVGVCGVAYANYALGLDYPLVHIPKGSFSINIPIYYSDKIEYVAKDVVFADDFYIGKYEVTNALWDECFKEKGCNKSSFYRAKEGRNNPSVRLNWHDAFRFTKWYSKKTGKKFRLPTEEEWAYAAYMGKEKLAKLSQNEITYDYSGKSAMAIAEKVTVPVGSINKNDWGMYDFYGNVWEWTLTCWYSSRENMLKKRTIAELNTPKACTTRIARGETRSHIPDFISDTYNGGCATLRPAANLGFRMLQEK